MELTQLAASNSIAVSGISFTNSVLRTGGLFSGLGVDESVVCDSIDSLDGGLTTGGVDDGLIFEARRFLALVTVAEKEKAEDDDGDERDPDAERYVQFKHGLSSFHWRDGRHGP